MNQLNNEKFLNFSQKNRKIYEDPSESIVVNFYVKNIEEITVNFYEIDTLRYFEYYNTYIFDNYISVDGIIP